jgi:prophage antirepressor-like protein
MSKMIDHPIQQFKHEEFGSIRTVRIDGEPWFVGKDVAEALGYERPTKAVQDRVEMEDKDEVPIQDSIGRMQRTPIIKESGLYSLILSSKLPSAKAFKRWVTSVVLPTIRKTGGFTLETHPFSKPEGVAALCKEFLTVTEKNAILAPKARYYDIILQSDTLVQTSLIAKDYGMSAITFNRLLHDLGIQYRMGNTWVLYQKYADNGYTKTRTYRASEITSVVHTYWTQKGRVFLYERLKQEGIHSAFCFFSGARRRRNPPRRAHDTLCREAESVSWVTHNLDWV